MPAYIIVEIDIIDPVGYEEYKKLAGATVEGPNSFAAHGSLSNMRPCPPDGVDTFAQFDRGGPVADSDQENVHAFRNCDSSSKSN